jgi:hypothetical protein
VRELRRRCALAAAHQLSLEFLVSYHSDDFAEAQDAMRALTAVGALCRVLRRTARDAQDRLAGIDTEPRVLTFC